jgi:hypothetical protein
MRKTTRALLGAAVALPIAIAATDIPAARAACGPCKPKAANPCSPCAAKKKPKCNPCAAKETGAPSNPCAAKKPRGSN